MGMKYFVLALFVILALGQQYGSQSDYYDDPEDVDAYVNWDQNYLCNGDFEGSQLPSGNEFFLFKTIPCWTATKGEIQIGKGYLYEETMQTQVMQLATRPETPHQGFQQLVNLTKGTYTLKFDYAPKHSQPPYASTFFVFFNDREVAKIRPTAKGVQTQILIVKAKEGQNTLEYVDASENPHYGPAIDNIGLYEWKINKIRTKEVDAVAVGGTVTWSTVLNIHRLTSQLDKDESSRGQAHTGWCPLSHKTVGNWIQVSTESLKLWNSVTIQGRASPHRQHVKKFKLMFSVDGFSFEDYANGKVFAGNSDANTKVRHNFEPFYALAIRLIPLEFHGSICLRWGATYLLDK